jgi:hypothetical protein
VRDVRLIDFARARQDHVLHDLLRLETEVVTKLLPAALAKADLPPETVVLLYGQLHGATLRSDPGQVHPALERSLAILHSIRQTVGDGLYDRDDPGEYYRCLIVYLVGALKFGNLDAASKRVAFWGAAALADLADKPLPDAGAVTVGKPVGRRWTRRAASVALVALLLLALILGGTLLARTLFHPMDHEVEPPFTAAIIGFQPKVTVVRAGTDRLIPATFGMDLYTGDVVSAYEGASANIICENGVLFRLPEQSNLTVDCRDTRDARVIGRLDPRLGVLAVSRDITFTLSSEQSRLSRLEQAQIPLLLGPRNTVITGTQPAFSWQSVPGARGYRLLLSMPDDMMWTRETTATHLTYPSDAVPFKKGSANVVIVTALDGSAQEMAADRSLLRVLDRAGQNALAQAETAVRELELDGKAKTYLLAQLYRDSGMRGAAADALEWLIGESAPSASLRQQLGDLYLEGGLYGRAEAAYQAALSIAEADADPGAQAAAHVGLARVTHALKETGQAVAHLEAAEALFRQAGETRLAELVLRQKDSLE